MPIKEYNPEELQGGGDPVSAPTAEDPSIMSQIGEGAKNLGIGALKGAGSTMSMADNFARQHLPAFMTNTGMGFGRPENIPKLQEQLKPQGDMQAIGKGVEQAGEFLIPGAAEEKVGAGLIKAAPGLGRAAAPLAKMATSALGAGAVNKAQGGDFSTGAEMGGAGAAIGAGARAVAPIAAETAMQLPKTMRGFGRTTGRAILDETSGVRPETVGRSAGDKIGELYGDLEKKATAASARPNRVKGLLAPPPQEIPLETGRYAGATPTSEGSPRDTLFQNKAPQSRGRIIDARVNPEEPMEPRSGNNDAPISEYPGINPHYLSGGAHPEMSGRFGPSKGVLRRPFQPPVGAPPLSPTEPATTASLRPARGVLGSSMDSARGQNARTLHGQLSAMQDTLGRRFDTGAPIPENVTPSDLLHLKQGFSDEHLRWNPDLHESAISTGRRAYNAMDKELDRTVPGAEQLNQRISSLIPAKIKGESISRGAPFLQRLGGRMAAHTGALTLGGMGAAGGYKEGGVPGAVAGGLAGIALPELLAEPTAQMSAARLLNRANTARPAMGILSQFTKRRDDQ